MLKEKSEYIPTSDLIIEETAKFYSLTAEDLAVSGGPGTWPLPARSPCI
jgi:hypothetical protein